MGMQRFLGKVVPGQKRYIQLRQIQKKMCCSTEFPRNNTSQITQLNVTGTKTNFLYGQ